MSVQHASTKTRKRSGALKTRLQGAGSYSLEVCGLHWSFSHSVSSSLASQSTWHNCKLPVLVQHVDTMQLTPGQVEALKGIGLSPGNYAAYIVAFTLATMVVCLVVSTLIVWRRSDDRMALLVAFMLVTLGPVNVTSTCLAVPFPGRCPTRVCTSLLLSCLCSSSSCFPLGSSCLAGHAGPSSCVLQGKSPPLSSQMRLSP